MNPEPSRLRQEQQAAEEQSSGVAEEQRHEGGREFASVEDLLRYDSELHPVPAEVGERLARAVMAEPKPERPWYKRIFGS
jgi:hypothetical protein